MPLHLLVPDLWPPAGMADACRGLSLPGLETLLGKGAIVESAAGEGEDWLLSTFRVSRRGDWPVAPLSLLGDGEDPGTGFWLRADPVFLRADATQLIFAGTPPEISREEAGVLAEALNRHFRPDGLAFLAPRPERWYLRLPAAPAIQTRSPREASGRPVDACLPAGPEALRWHALLNEIQMLLHIHPVNEARESRGDLPVNSVWLWGGGVLPGSVASPFARIWSNDPTATGLALAAGLTPRALPATASDCLSDQVAGGSLAVLDGLREPARRRDAAAWREAVHALEEAWFTLLTAALREKRLPRLEIHASGETRTRNAAIDATDFWRFWRGPRRLGAG